MVHADSDQAESLSIKEKRMNVGSQKLVYMGQVAKSWIQSIEITSFK